MDQARFDAMVAALEQESATAPKRYRMKVAALALLGFGILGIVIGFSSLGLLLLAGLPIAFVISGGKGLILLFKFGKLLVVLAVPMWLLLKSSLQALFTRFPTPEGVEVTRDHAPQLFAAMDRMRARMKGPRFHHVLLTDEVNAAVVQRPLFGLLGVPRNYLLLGLPLLEAVTPEEALAVVAHEYGHLAGSHGRFGAFIYRLRITWGTIESLIQQWSGRAIRPVQKLVSWYAPYFNAYTFVLARTNEYEADAASANLVGPDVAASALKRINLVAPHYERFNAQTFGAVRDQPAPPLDRSTRWAGVAVRGIDDERRRTWLGEALTRSPHPMDTHPALHQRLRALPGQAPHIDELPVPLAVPSAAITWLGEGLGALRDRMQSDWHARMAEPWRQRHDELQQRLGRLAELDAMAEPGADEQEERLRLRLELDPGEDHVPALAAFNAEHPDRPVTWFLEGRERLAHDDEAGLAALERAMALDSECICPASVCAWAWLARRNDARAETWRRRWIERSELESRRDHELHHFDEGHALQPHGLDASTVAESVSLVRGTRGVCAAYLMRRVLPSAPELATYVLGVELTYWAVFRRRGPAIVDRLARHEWPMHLFIFALVGRRNALRKTMKRDASARLTRE